MDETVGYLIWHQWEHAHTEVYIDVLIMAQSVFFFSLLFDETHVHCPSSLRDTLT